MEQTERDAPGEIVLGDALTPADIPALCEVARGLLDDRRRTVVICNVANVTRPDAVTVDAIARLQLTAKRMDSVLRLRGTCPRLRELIDLAGLSDALPSSPG